jgi:hypothetical protein
MEIKKFEQLNEEVTNYELLRLMVDLSNNSQLTNTTAVMLSQILSDEEMRELIRWMRHAKSERDIDINNAKRKFY